MLILHSKFHFLLIFLMFALILPTSGLAAISQEPGVIITGYSISPNVILPGEIGTIEVTIANTASQASKTASEISGTEPDSVSQSVTLPVNAFIESAILKTKDFQILSGWYEDIGEIGPGQSTTLTFLVQAPIKEGLYFPEVWIRVRGAESVKYPIPVNINTRHTLIKQPSIRLSRSTPTNIIPGSAFDIELGLTNEGLSGAHDLIIAIETPNTSLSSKSPERQFIQMLEPGQTKKINLSFQTDNDIPIGIRQIPVRISYMNADGTELEQRERIGIVIQGTADLGISKQTLDPEQIAEGDMFNLVCRIENTGTDKAKTVRATLDIPFEGTKEAFVGTIRPDNDAPAVFTLKATKSGDISYTMKIEYQDDFGIHEETIPLHIFAQEKNGTGIIIFILAVVLIIAGLLYWRKSYS